MTRLPTVEIGSLPQTVQGFATLQAKEARTPEGGAAMMVVALLLYAGEEVLGEGCLAAAVDGERLRVGAPVPCLGRRDLQLIASQIGGRSQVLHSYLEGAVPENGYQLPEPPFRIKCSGNLYSGDAASGRYKVFVVSSGADSPRPVTVQRDEHGVWKAREWSSLLLGVKEPAEGDG